MTIEYRVKALASAEENIAAIENKVPFKRCFDDIEETLELRRQVIKFWAWLVHFAHTNFLVGEVSCNCYHNSSRKEKTLSGFGILK